MTAHDPWIGRQLAGFQIERLLGQGGMASVYFGWDLKLQRPVAIKMIDERHRGDPAYIERFRREAQTIAAWHHPNILQIYSAGEEDGQVFFVMEYVRGRDLQQALDQYGRAGLSISMAEIMRIGRAVASALDYAHGRGVIHRDVKPSNIIIAEDGRVVLADFGIALQTSGSTLGQVFGSPHYISPEQARSSASVVPQSDLYSLGVILYEMLTGTVPFHDPSPTTLALQHISSPPPPPRQFNPTLSPEVEVVLLKSLSKVPHERYPTAHAMMDALEMALQTGVADSQPMTMRVLPGQSAPPTQAAQPVQAEATIPAALPPYIPSARAPSEPAATQAALPYRPAPARRSWVGRYVTCALLAVGLLVLAAGGVFAISQSGLLAAQGRTPTSQASTMETQVAQLPPTETTQPSPTAQPTQTPDLPATETAVYALLPTVTFTPPPSPTATTPPSATPTVTPTPLAYDITLARRGNESIFIVNSGDNPVPVPLLVFGTSSRAIEGEEWQVSELLTGQCLAAWDEGRNPPVPRGLECERVGERVLRTGNRRFWTRDFDVFFAGERIARCDSDEETCEIQFTAVPDP